MPVVSFFIVFLKGGGFPSDAEMWLNTSLFPPSLPPSCSECDDHCHPSWHLLGSRSNLLLLPLLLYLVFLPQEIKEVATLCTYSNINTCPCMCTLRKSSLNHIHAQGHACTNMAPQIFVLSSCVCVHTLPLCKSQHEYCVVSVMCHCARN